jgi:hypothetical protein
MGSFVTHDSLAENNERCKNTVMQTDPIYLLSVAMEGGFYVLLFIFTLHALFLGYHWFTFGAKKQTSMLALSIYLSGGAILLLTIALSIFTY